MWLWLQRRLPKPVALFGKLVFFSAFLHICTLFVIFFIYKGDSGVLSFSINSYLTNRAAPVIFLPFYKRIEQKTSKGNAVSQDNSTIKKAHNNPKLEETKEKVVKDKQTTRIVTCPNKKIKQKKTAKKTKKSQEDSKKKKVVEQKQLEKKIEPKKTLPKNDQNTETQKLKQSEQSLAQQIDTSPDDVHYVGRMDLDALHMHEYINKEISTHWKPPLGIAKDKTCSLKIRVNWQGTLHALSVHKSSGIRIYDTSASQAVQMMNFPKWLWGKEFTITFKQ